jgi:hypothetical protein
MRKYLQLLFHLMLDIPNMQGRVDAAVNKRAFYPSLRKRPLSEFSKPKPVLK